jgi:hypothetical protein
MFPVRFELNYYISSSRNDFAGEGQQQFNRVTYQPLKG